MEKRVVAAEVQRDPPADSSCGCCWDYRDHNVSEKTWSLCGLLSILDDSSTAVQAGSQSLSRQKSGAGLIVTMGRPVGGF